MSAVMNVVARWLLLLLCACGFAFPVAAQTVVTLSTQYSAPQYVAVDGDRTVIVTDSTNPLSALHVVNGAYATTPTAFPSTGGFASPKGVAVDQGGDVFAVTNYDAQHAGLWEFQSGSYSNIYAESLSLTANVQGTAIDSKGSFYFTNNSELVYALPGPGHGFAVPITVGQAGTDHATGIAFDNANNMFVADQLSGSGRILELTAASGYATVNAITSGNFKQPVGVAVDTRGNLYVTDSANNTLTELVAPDYTTAAVIDSTHFSGPMGVAVDADDNIFVVDTGHNALKEIPAQPAVTALAATAGPVAGGNTVTITGLHLSGVTAVSFGGSAASSFTGVSDTQVTATAPAGSAGTVDVRVTTANGTSIAVPADKYTYIAAPTVGGLSPASGPTAGGNLVTITGANLTAASAVTFGATAATSFTVNSATQITAIAPPRSVGTVDVRVTTVGGTSATGSADHYTYLSAPVVSGLSSTHGPTGGGTTVTIAGSGFTGATAVKFGATAAASFTVVSDTQVTATAPAGSAGAVDVTVTTVGGVSASSAADAFIYVAVPVVSGLSVASGPTSGGTLVVITGSNLRAANSVNFGAAAATSFTVNSATQITAIAPPRSVGTVDVTVTTTGGTSATIVLDQYTYLAVPVVSALSPAHGPIAGGTTVTVTGSAFTAATAVNFGATPATRFTVNSATQITAIAPSGSAGAVDVTVTTPAGASAAGAADAFTYVAAPVVSGLSPTDGPASGGTSIVITGSNLRAASAVTFGATAATSFTVNSATQITAIAPPGSAGTVDVTVTTVGGTSAATAADQYTYLSVPVVSALSPMHGPTAGGTTVTITGSAFTNATAVQFGATAATSFTVVSATQITAIAPPSSAGAVDVTVTTPAGASTTGAADAFTYVAAPVVNGLSPASGPVAGGKSVVITGSNLRTASAVTFGATAATSFTVNSATQITAIAPAGSVGAVDVTVTTLGGTSATIVADQYTYLAAPTVSRVTPSLGPIQGGTTVAIVGSGFTGATAVTFGTVAAGTISVVNDRRITVTAPAHDAGQVDVRVTAPNGTTAIAAGDSFTYVAPPIAGAVAATVDYDSTANAVALALTGGPADSVLVGAAPTHGTATASGTTIRYAPAAGYVGDDSFTYRAKNVAGTSALANVSVTVEPPDATVLYRFTDGADGAFPSAPLAIGTDNTLYGAITPTGNAFSLTPPKVTPGTWRFALLRSFTTPALHESWLPAGLFHDDTTGALYGIAGNGRCTPTEPARCGEAYMLTPTKTGRGPWPLKRLYPFGKAVADADNPISPFVTGADRSLYGMSSPVAGSTTAFGAIFRLAPPAKTGGAWTQTVLYSFKGGADGMASAQALLVDRNGNLYGVTAGVDATAPGNVFRLSPPASGKTAWTKTILHKFRGPNGAFPSSPLITDNTGALYGVTSAGGTPRGAAGTGSGLVYKLTPPSSGEAWTETVLHRFTGGQDGAAPMGPIVFDATGAIDGATRAGGGNGFGSVFRLSPPVHGAAWSETLLHSFKGDSNGGVPLGGVVLGSDGALYGETRAGGIVTTDTPHGAGTIYRIVLSGP